MYLDTTTSQVAGLSRIKRVARHQLTTQAINKWLMVIKDLALVRQITNRCATSRLTTQMPFGRVRYPAAQSSRAASMASQAATI